MTTFEILLQQIGLFVIYILAGVTLVRTKVLNRETLEPISKFVIKMALPVMIFINIIDGVNKEILTGSWSILLIAAGSKPPLPGGVVSFTPSVQSIS